MVELAFKLNNKKEHHSAFCPLTKKSIYNEFELSINSKKSMIVGNFRNNQLTELLGCYFDKEKANADCLGPYEDYYNQFVKLHDSIFPNIYVSGKAILNHLVGYAFGNYNIETIELIVDADNENAISFYTSMGFIINAENCCYIAK